MLFKRLKMHRLVPIINDPFQQAVKYFSNVMTMPKRAPGMCHRR